MPNFLVFDSSDHGIFNDAVFGLIISICFRFSVVGAISRIEKWKLYFNESFKQHLQLITRS